MLIRSWTLFGLESANLDSKSATTHLVFVDWKSDTRKRNVRYEIPSTFKRLDVVSALIGSFSKILLKVLLWPKANNYSCLRKQLEKKNEHSEFLD